ncbi:hypothetical protein ACFOY2_05125 [Nonomuraea purpurea]|uniref:Uncharacterized protein n=1 Tax=Nonomuraea purpurea TaxID=1849276 RepID=A0ABV8G1R0_9ACTN
MPEPRTPIHVSRLLLRAVETERATDGMCERGAALLNRVAAAYRLAAEIYTSDPTLERCPAGRERQLDLAAEICRQILPRVRSAIEGRQADRWPVEDRWEEAEALAARLPDILAEARAQARTDHATPDGSREISRMWLAHSSHRIHLAGEGLRDAVAKAKSLPHPDPEIAELEALADEIVARAEKLEKERTGF